MKAMQAIERNLSPQEMAGRVRLYHECMEPHIKAVANTLDMFTSTQYLMAGGEIAERIYTPEQRALIDSLDELSRMYMARLGLASPSGEK